MKMGLQVLQTRCINQLYVFDLVGRCTLLQPIKTSIFVRIRGDDQLTASSVGYAPFLAMAVQHVPAPNTEARLETSRFIIKAGVNDFAVAGGCAVPDGVLSLQQQNLDFTQGQSARDSQADHASADNNYLDLQHWL